MVHLAFGYEERNSLIEKKKLSERIRIDLPKKGRNRKVKKKKKIERTVTKRKRDNLKEITNDKI